MTAKEGQDGAFARAIKRTTLPGGDIHHAPNVRNCVEDAKGYSRPRISYTGREFTIVSAD